VHTRVTTSVVRVDARARHAVFIRHTSERVRRARAYEQASDIAVFGRLGMEALSRHAARRKKHRQQREECRYAHVLSVPVHVIVSRARCSPQGFEYLRLRRIGPIRGIVFTLLLERGVVVFALVSSSVTCEASGQTHSNAKA
jgi:hypothetical protein